MAIDPATRGLTLRGIDGKDVEVTAGPEVRNYDKLKVGDKVDMSYIERLDLELIKGGGDEEAGGGEGIAEYLETMYTLTPDPFRHTDSTTTAQGAAR